MCCEITARGRRRDSSGGIGAKGHLWEQAQSFMCAHRHLLLPTAICGGVEGASSCGKTNETTKTKRQNRLISMTARGRSFCSTATGDFRQINEQRTLVCAETLAYISSCKWEMVVETERRPQNSNLNSNAKLGRTCTKTYLYLLPIV